MDLIIKKSHAEVPGFAGRSVWFDVTFADDGFPKPVIIFSHGFKGFKDWGHYNLLAEHFAHEGFVFVKINFSHNGVTPASPTDFSDLEAFGNNNFSKELDDLGAVIDHISDSTDKNYNVKEIYLMGHSRGGGISILKAAEDPRVKKVATWAAPSTFERYSPEQVKEWREKGVLYVENSRTKQQMPLYYQLADDFYKNKERLDISSALKKIKVPLLVIHGDADDVVGFEEARSIKAIYPETELLKIPGGDHTFSACHPFTDKQLPAPCETAFRATVNFFKKRFQN